MSSDFTAAAARARGLSTHLFTRPELEALAGADAPSLARALARSPRLRAPLGDAASPFELERAMRRTASEYLRTLSKWAGAGPVLGVFEARQDRRSLRALIRGALATAPAEDRLAGLLSTPTLPERVLTELARQPTPAAVVAQLFALGHPDAGRLAGLVAAAQPDLLALEQALAHGEAARASAEAARGDAHLRRFVALGIDAQNAQTALVLASVKEPDAEPWFVEGGLVLSQSDFLGVVTAPQPALRLRQVLSSTPLSELVEDPALEAARFERAAFAHALRSQREAARRDPLSSAPLLSFLLRLEAQARDLRRLLWGAALGAPAALINSELVTP